MACCHTLGWWRVEKLARIYKFPKKFELRALCSAQALEVKAADHSMYVSGFSCAPVAYISVIIVVLTGYIYAPLFVAYTVDLSFKGCVEHTHQTNYLSAVLDYTCCVVYVLCTRLRSIYILNNIY